MPLVKFKYWWIRFFDFPHAQFTAFGVLIFILLVVKDKSKAEWILLGIMIPALIYCSWLIMPYTIFSKKKSLAYKGSSAERDRVSILCANVYMYNEDHEALARIIDRKDADLVLLMECDEKWAAAMQGVMEERYPYQLLHPLPNTYGLLFYSKNKFREAEIQFLVEEDVPSVHAVMELESGRPIGFYGIHPRPPAPGENERSLERDAELVLLARLVRKNHLPCIVAGDLNDVAWSHTTRLFIRMSGLLDPRIGRGFFNTFHTRLPLLRWPLDHIFLDHHFKVQKIERLESFGSDHFPIFIDVVYEPGPEAVRNKERAGLADRIEAKEIIRNV